MNWKAPISLTTKPKDAQFYARLNADDAWKHKYKAYCFSWTQGQSVKEPPREFAILDQTTAARNAAIVTARRMQEQQAAEVARKQAEAAAALQAQIKQQRDEIDAVAILSAGFGAGDVKDAAQQDSKPTGSAASSTDTADASDGETPATASDSGAEAEAEASADEAAAVPPPPLLVALAPPAAGKRKRGARGDGDAAAGSGVQEEGKPKRRSLKQDLKKAKEAPKLQWM
mmetsp:Transcript_15451/g.41712  ORF Transcript_15451/g.41712 Transcript_15451/m.41712 type:complete len:229 (-) Transcript_15451:155-841(-)